MHFTLKRIPFLAAFLVSNVFFTANAQNVGINNTDPKAALDVNGGLRLRPLATSVVGATVVLPGNRAHHVLEGEPSNDFTVTLSGTTQPGQHLIITNKTMFTASLLTQPIPASSTVEFIYSGEKWRKIGSSSEEGTAAWGLTGNAGTNEALNFIGTTDNKPLLFRAYNQKAGIIDPQFYNTAIGINTLANAESSYYNVALGYNALQRNGIGKNFVSQSQNNVGIGSFALTNNTRGSDNIAVGYSAMYSNKSGNGSVAMGYNALYSDTAATELVAIGLGALYRNNNRRGNVAVGYAALYDNGLGADITTSQAIENTAVGTSALSRNQIGSFNTAVGTGALTSNKFGSNAVAIGRRAARFDSVANGVIAIGANALDASLSGEFNIAIGESSLAKNIMGNGNIAIGNKSGFNEMGANKLYIENSDANKDNALIYGDFAADSLLLNAKTVVRNNAVVRGFTKLGGYEAEVPAIKMKKIIIPAGPAVDGLATYPFGSGITDSKVLGVDVLMKYDNAGTSKIPPSYRDAAGYEYNIQIQFNGVTIINKPGNSANIGAKQITILVTYEE